MALESVFKQKHARPSPGGVSERGLASGPVKGISTVSVREACVGRLPRLADTSLENSAVRSERILSAAAGRTRPVVFSEMSGCPGRHAGHSFHSWQGLRASLVRRPAGPGGSFMASRGGLSKNGTPHKGLLVELRNSDALVEFYMLQTHFLERAS